MNNTTVEKMETSQSVIKIAMKNYKTYQEFYKNKGLNPMTFDEFLSNYLTDS